MVLNFTSLHESIVQKSDDWILGINEEEFGLRINVSLYMFS